MTDEPGSNSCRTEAILFDFGGVLAEEGFRLGLASIAEINGLEPESFAKTGFRLIFEVGYAVGRADEKTFWHELRKITGAQGSDEMFRDEILSHFILRPDMIELVKKLKAQHVHVAILSDQTQWLDELNARYDFFKWFDYVFNSYHMGKSKKDPATFVHVLQRMGVSPDRALFVDDDRSNVERAGQAGLHALWFREQESFFNELAAFCPFLHA